MQLRSATLAATAQRNPTQEQQGVFSEVTPDVFTQIAGFREMDLPPVSLLAGHLKPVDVRDQRVAAAILSEQLLIAKAAQVPDTMSPKLEVETGLQSAARLNETKIQTLASDLDILSQAFDVALRAIKSHGDQGSTAQISKNFLAHSAQTFPSASLANDLTHVIDRLCLVMLNHPELSLDDSGRDFANAFVFDPNGTPGRGKPRQAEQRVAYNLGE